MGTRSLWMVAIVVVLGATGCGAGLDVGERVPDCVAPSNERALLDRYAEDPVLAVVPEGADRQGRVNRTEACVQGAHGSVSNTSVNLRLRLSRQYDEPALRRAYETAAAKAGWRPDPDGSPATSMSHETYLTYCRRDGDVISRLSIHSAPDQHAVARPPDASRPGPSWVVDGPGGIFIVIHASPSGARCRAMRR